MCIQSQKRCAVDAKAVSPENCKLDKCGAFVITRSLSFYPAIYF